MLYTESFSCLSQILLHVDVSLCSVNFNIYFLFWQTLDHLPLTDPENFGTPVVQVCQAKLCECLWLKLPNFTEINLMYVFVFMFSLN